MSAWTTTGNESVAVRNNSQLGSVGVSLLWPDDLIAFSNNFEKCRKEQEAFENKAPPSE